MNNTKKIFLITMQQRKPYHIQNLKNRYKEQIIFVDNPGEADLVLYIGRKDINNPDLLKAQEMGIKISYFTDEMLPEQVLQDTLRRESAIRLVKDEIAFSGEEL